MTISFPKIDPTALRVVWAPLLVRPIARGPECFVAAIAAQSHSGRVGAYPLFDRRRVGVLFEDHSCPCHNSGAWTVLMGPHNITRSIVRKPDGTYKYRIEKHEIVHERNVP